MRGVGRDIRRGLLACLAATVAAAALPAAAGAEPQRPAPPTSSEVRELTRDYVRRHALPAQPREVVASASAKPPRRLFGRKIHVAFYGSPQLTGTVLGKNSPKKAMRKLKRQARGYRKAGKRPVARAVDLIGVIATADPGPDRLYRTRQSNRVIANYLNAARSIGARLVLDIQPGRAKVLAEMRAMRRWLREPDVDVAIDPEWNVGPRGIPGRTEGSINAKDLNRATAWLDRLVERRGLPPKALIVHQFRDGSIRHRGRVKQGEKVEVLLNFDGIGTARAKKVGYRRLAIKRLFNGFSLFYSLDDGLMRPRAVLRLKPRVDYAMYQ